MRSTLILITFLSFTTVGKAQNVDSIYSFMNNELPSQEFGKSTWGIFFLDHPVILDSVSCNKFLKSEVKNVPKSVVEELYKKCIALNYEWQHNFHWKQSKMQHDIVVVDTKHKLPFSLLQKLKWKTNDLQKAKYWTKEWNLSKVDDRLINYSSIPIFSNDRQYVLIFRGQDVKSEGGWDTIYIYRKEGNKWIVAEKLVVAEI